MATQTPPSVPNAALREIAGRIQRLTYREMNDLADALGLAAVVILKAADKLEKA